VHGSTGQRDTRFLNELNEILRTPSMLSLRPGDVPPLHSKLTPIEERGRLPPINGEKEEKLFDQLPRRSSLELEKGRRPDSPLSLRSPNGSVPSSASPAFRLPPISVSAPPAAEVPTHWEREEMRQSLQGIHSVIGRRRGRRRRLSAGAVDEDAGSGESRHTGLRRSNSYEDLGSVADLRSHGRASSLRDRRRPDRLAFAGRRRGSIAEVSDDDYDEGRLPSVLAQRRARRRASLHDNGLRSLPSITGGGRTSRQARARPPSETGSVVSFSLGR